MSLQTTTERRAATARPRLRDGPNGERVYIRRVFIARRSCRALRYYMVFTLSGTFSRYLQAADREAAKRLVLATYDDAVFWR